MSTEHTDRFESREQVVETVRQEPRPVGSRPEWPGSVRHQAHRAQHGGRRPEQRQPGRRHAGSRQYGRGGSERCHVERSPDCRGEHGWRQPARGPTEGGQDQRHQPGNADLTEADLTESSWFGVNVSGADFSEAKTTGARASGVDWSQANVPPAEIPEPIPVPPWLPALLAGIGVLFGRYPRRAAPVSSWPDEGGAGRRREKKGG